MFRRMMIVMESRRVNTSMTMFATLRTVITVLVSTQVPLVMLASNF